jgi:hypothetical protein
VGAGRRSGAEGGEVMKKRHRGLHEHRFKENPEERRFAEAWAKQNEDGKTLAHLLDANGRSWPPDPSDRDYEVAATVVQWLGSPVGQRWLEKMGYVPYDERRRPGASSSQSR